MVRDGYGIIAGRSAANARAALDAADAAGVDQTEVLAVDEGYEVPLAVLDAYEKKAGYKDAEEPKDAEADAEESDRPPKNASKNEWVEFAAKSGYDESEGLTKDQLIERYGE